MRSKASVSVVLALVLSFLTAPAAYGGTENKDQTLSPYFFVKSEDPGIDSLPLKSTNASVNIAGVIADVTVTQLYKNEGSRPLEAIYIFPASTRAAVYGMKMTIGERVVEAKIMKRGEARQAYEDAKLQGRSASLLEQQRPNVFQMNVANIMPGDEIRVELRYTELLIPEDATYEFVYPTVVGPRYSNRHAEDAPSSEGWVRNPYLHQGEAPNYEFDITVSIAAGLPVGDIQCSSHKVDIGYDGPTRAVVRLAGLERQGGNRDYVLRYRLAGEKIESGLLLYKGDKENFFLLMMQPPKRLSIDQVPGREYIFIVDVSGSMHGFPLDISKKLLKDLIGNLRQTDKFNVLLFAGGNSVMSERSLPATNENIQKAVDLIERQRGGGGTELLPALKRALDLPGSEAYSRTVVVVTDGYVTVEEEAFDLIRQSLGDANMFAFGIGSSVNRYIIEGMARVGMGEPFVITKPDEAAARAETFRKMIASPVLTDIEVRFGGLDVYDVEPPRVPDVLAERPVIVFGKWRGKPSGRITLRGISGNGDYSGSLDTDEVEPSKKNSGLRYLWARHRIALLSDYNSIRSDDKRTKEVTALGLKYNLLTAYTSFVAVDSEIRNIDGKTTTVTQPLPLPEGVSDLAVGGEMARYAAAPVMSKARSSMADAMEPKEERETISGKAENGPAVIRITVSDKKYRDRIEKEIRRHLDEIGRCYITSSGKVIVSFSINSQGTVQNAVIEKDETGDKKGSKCLVQEIRKLKFLNILKGGTVKVTMTLMMG